MNKGSIDQCFKSLYGLLSGMYPNATLAHAWSGYGRHQQIIGNLPCAGQPTSVLVSARSAELAAAMKSSELDYFDLS